jgi:hypothetical protein
MYRSISKSMTKPIGLFVPIMRELKEMYYQNDRDYEFNSDKFKKRFGIKATPYLEGIKSIVDQDYK